MAAKFTRFSEKRDTTGSDTTSYDDAVDGVEPDECAGLHIPLPENNMGFMLMQKMGWSTGLGLGKNEQGRKDPVPLELKGDNMGLGRFQMELDLATEATEKRKQLEIEKDLTPGLIKKYKAQVAKEQAIADATEEMRKTYHCELCEKQYTKYSEYDNHLNSYDHHHRQRLKDLKLFETGLKAKTSRVAVEEVQQKKASLKAVAKERAQMKVERYQQLLEGGDLPGFKPMGFRRKRPSSSSSSSSSSIKPVVDVAAMIESREAITAALRKRSSEDIAESERKIAAKKGRLAKYGVKFQSAGHLATIGSEEMSSYQSGILGKTLTPSTTLSVTTATSSSGLYAGRFVSAGEMKEVKEEEKEEEKEREKRLSELPQASGRKAELHMAAAEKEEEEEEGESDDEDFTSRARKRILKGKEEQEKKKKKTTQSKQMTLKLTDKYESYYY